MIFAVFFVKYTATTEIYTLSLHDALPISHYQVRTVADGRQALEAALADPPDLVVSDVMMPELDGMGLLAALDRKSTRLNSSHANISYAVFCLKKKTK